MPEATKRIIKRYANRKLYDTQESRYVTLDQISHMIRAGEDVQVLDNNSKEDLTSVTLAQIIFEEEKKQRSFLPLSALRNIIQTGGASFQDLVTQLSESSKRVGRVFQHEDSEQVQGEGEGEAKPAISAESESHNFIRDFRESFQGSIDEWQRRLDDSMNTALESLSPLAPLQKEVQSLRERLAEMEKKLGKIEK